MVKYQNQTNLAWGDEGCNARDSHGGFLKQNCFNDVKVLLDCWVAGVLMPSDLVDVGSKPIFLLPPFSV